MVLLQHRIKVKHRPSLLAWISSLPWALVKFVHSL
jgi:hypothetical protein